MKSIFAVAVILSFSLGFCENEARWKLAESYVEYVNTIGELLDTTIYAGSTGTAEDYTNTFKSLEKRKGIWDGAKNCLSNISEVGLTESELELKKTAVSNADLAKTIIDAEANLLEGFLNGDEKNPGTISRKLGKFTNDYEAVTKLAVMNSILFVQTLVDSMPDENGKMSYLWLTSDQRKEISNSLINEFGKGIKGGMKPGMDRIKVTAAIICHFVNGEHKSSDQRGKGTKPH